MLKRYFAIAGLSTAAFIGLSVGAGYLVAQINPTGDISVMTTRPATVLQGTRLSYTNVVFNDSAVQITTTLYDAVSPGLTWVPASSPEADCSLTPDGASVYCKILLSPGASAAVPMTYAIDPSLPCGTVFSGWGVDIDTPGFNDTNPSNDRATQTTTLTCAQEGADFGLTLTSSSGAVLRGSIAMYEASIRNLGPADAAALVAFLLPPGTTFAGSSGGCATQDDRYVVCTDGARMLQGQGAIYRINLRFDEVLRCGSDVRQRALVLGDATDPDMSNNVAPLLKTRVLCQ